MKQAGPFVSLALAVLLGASCDQGGGPASGASRSPEAQQAFRRARELYGLDQPFEAIAEMRKVVAAAPDWAEAQLALGKLLMTYSDVRFSTATIDRGRLAEAIDHMQRAAALEPANADAAYWAGYALSKADRGPEATKEFERALALRPEHGPTLKQLGLLSVADGDSKKAIELLGRAEKQLPKDDEIPFQLGMQLEVEDRLEEARDELLKAADLNRGHPGPRSILIRIYRRLGDEAAAQRMQAEFERCRAFGKRITQASLYFDEHSREPGACMGIAELYREVGMPDQAILWAERALRLDPQHEPARELLRALGKPAEAPAPAEFPDGQSLDSLKGIANPGMEQ